MKNTEWMRYNDSGDRAERPQDFVDIFFEAGDALENCALETNVLWLELWTMESGMVWTERINNSKCERHGICVCTSRVSAFAWITIKALANVYGVGVTSSEWMDAREIGPNEIRSWCQRKSCVVAYRISHIRHFYFYVVSWFHFLPRFAIHPCPMTDTCERVTGCMREMRACVSAFGIAKQKHDVMQ